MKFILCAVVVGIANSLASPCSEPTTIQIHNFDGPIYLQIPGQYDDDEYTQCCPQAEIECTCIAKPSIKYIPINTASESQCYNRNCGSRNGGTCSCGNYNGGACSGGAYDRGSCSCGAHNGGSCTCGSYSQYANGRKDKVYTYDIVRAGSDGYNNPCICHKCY